MSYRPSDLLRGVAIPDVVLRALPKADLHATLDGSLRPATAVALAAAAGVDAPTTPAAITRDHVLGGLQTTGHLERAVRELAEDAAACGVKVLELRVSPLRHGRDGLTPEAVVAAAHQGLQAAVAGHGLRAGILVTGLRSDTPLQNQELSRLAVSWHGRGVVGFALGGDEFGNEFGNECGNECGDGDGGSSDDHREAFYHAKNNNLPSTCDAGLTGGVDSIHVAVHRYGAMRIGRAVRLEEGPELLDFINDHRIPLEICFSSDLAAGAVASAASHPLRKYHEAGLRVCLNTDQTLFVGTDLTRELRLAVDTFDLTLLDLEDLVLAGFKSAFLPERTARVLIEGALADFKRIRDLHQLDDLVARGGP